MSKRQSDVIPEPSTPPTPDADSFGVPADGDSFAPPTDAQAVALWAELRELLDTLVGRAATPADRDKANSILSRLGLAAELAPLMLVAVRESVELEAVVAAGIGKVEEVSQIERELRGYGNLAPATSVQANQSAMQEKERLSAAWLAANRLAEAALMAARRLHHNHSWLWCLWTPEASPFPIERDLMGNERRKNAGGLTNSLIGPKLQEAAGQMGLDCYKIDAWRTCVRAEPGPRRRFRTSAINSPSPVSALGQTPYSPSRF